MCNLFNGAELKSNDQLEIEESLEIMVGSCCSEIVISLRVSAGFFIDDE